jgi:protein-L-isoaspartate(D-aspartate) O-methyltransferase
MVAPVGEDKTQKMLRITKDMHSNVTETEMGDFKFVPMLEGKNSK